MNSAKNKFLLFLTVFIDMMGFSVIFPIFPNTLHFYINQGDDQVLRGFLRIAHLLSGEGEEGKYFIVLFGGLLGSTYAFLQFFFSPIWGKLSDRVGRRTILVFTSLGSLLGYLLWFFAGSFSLFVLSRIVTGAMGGNISVASASMADMTEAKDRAKGMGIIGAGIGLGFVLGPPLGGILSKVNLINYFPALANFGLTIFSSTALLSVLIAFVNLVLIVFLFKETITIRKEILTSKNIHPVFGLDNNTIKELPILCLLYFSYTFGFSGFEFCINFFLSQNLSLSPEMIGYFFVYMGGIIVLVQGGIVRRISGKVSEINISFLGTILLIIGFILVYFASSSAYTLVCLTFLSVGSAFLNPGISSMASLFSSAEEQGKNLGTLRGFGSLARAFAPITYSIIYFKMGPNNAFLLSFIIMIIVFFLLLKLSREKTKHEIK